MREFLLQFLYLLNVLSLISGLFAIPNPYVPSGSLLTYKRRKKIVNYMNTTTSNQPEITH
jgi:hypothetical protein